MAITGSGTAKEKHKLQYLKVRVLEAQNILKRISPRKSLDELRGTVAITSIVVSQTTMRKSSTGVGMTLVSH